MEEKIYLDNDTLYINEETIHKGFLEGLNIDKSQVINLCILGNVKYIEDYAFEGFNALKEIWAYSEEEFLENPPSLKKIGKRAFANCSSLERIEFPYTLEYVGEDAFIGCDTIGGNNLICITSKDSPSNYDFWYNIEFENSYANPLIYGPLTYYCFPENEEVEVSFSNIPSTVRIINSNVLSGLEIENLIIPSNVTSISSKAFIECKVTSISVDSRNLVYDSRNYCNAIIENSTNTLIFGNQYSRIVESVTNIGDYAFYDNKELTSIILPSTIERIGDYSFYGCVNLKKVLNNSSLPLSKGNSNYGYISFYTKLLVEYDTIIEDTYYFKLKNGTNYLTYYTGNPFVVFPNNMGNYKIGEYAFMDSDITDLYFTDSVEAIEEGAFFNCKNLSRIWSISINLEYIGHNAFYGCDNIAQIQIFDIERWCIIDFKSQYSNPINANSTVYLNNTKLEDLIIPDTTKELKPFTFCNCSSIKNIYIPSSVEKIDISAFDNCCNITTIEVDIDNLIYNSTDNCNAVIHKESNTLILGCQSTEIPSNVEGIGEKAFASRILESKDIDLNSSELSYIGNNAFAECVGLNTIKVPKTLYSIGDNAFYNCINIKFSNFQDINDNITNLKYIGVGAFTGCSKGVFRISFSKDLEVISNGAFKDCNFIDSRLDIPEKSNLKVIGDEAFFNTKWRNSEGTSKLYGSFEDEFSNGFQNLIKIGDRAFYNSDLGGLYNSNNITIGNSAFEECSHFEGVTLPNVIYIGSRAFYGCSKLNKVLLGLNLKEIKDYTFAKCPELKYLYIPYGVINIGDCAFYDENTSPVLNFGTHSMVPKIGKYIAKNWSFIVTPKWLDSSWETTWKVYDDSRLFNYYTIDKGYSDSSGLLFPRYIVFNIDKYTFLAEQDMTWEEWCNPDYDYSKVYMLPSSVEMNEWSYSRIIKIDERTALDSKKAINWPCTYDVLSVGKLNSINESPTLVSIKNKIEDNGTYVVTRGYKRSFIYNNDGELEYQGGL